jgi:hypothetical protein
VNYLIKLVGRVLARQIEKGSKPGATVGAGVGIFVGLAIAFVITLKHWVGRDYLVAMYLICPIPLAIGGALVGAAVGP